jgi:hypothetical protein
MLPSTAEDRFLNPQSRLSSATYVAVDARVIAIGPCASLTTARQARGFVRREVRYHLIGCAEFQGNSLGRSLIFQESYTEHEGSRIRRLFPEAHFPI